MGRVSMLCNDSELIQEEGAWRVEGDPTEGALDPFATKLGMDRQAERAAAPRIDAIPFESEHKFMATLHTFGDDGEALLVKGAPEVILDHCDRQQMAAGQTAPLDRPHFCGRPTSSPPGASGCWRLRGSSGRASRPAVSVQSDLPRTLVLLGLVGLLDPPRKRGHRGSKGMPWRRNPGHDDNGRSQDHRGGHRQNARGIGDGKTAITGAEIEAMDNATLQERVRDVRRLRPRQSGA